MRDWLDEIAGPDFAPAVFWTLLALVILIVLLVIVRQIRGMTFGTFVVGGRNRKTRLAVMDATAVDTHRRLVLVRRDDVEHLILIGGPTDVVVEQNIRFGQQQRRPAPPQDIAAYEQQVQRPPEAQPAPPPPQQRQAAQPARPQPPREPRIASAPPQPERPARAAPPPPRAPEPRPAPPPRAAPARIEPPRPEPTLSSTTRDTYLPRDMQDRGKAPARSETVDIDKALVDELNLSLDEPMISAKHPPAKQDVSLEDEMNKLLGELTGGRRK